MQIALQFPNVRLFLIELIRHGTFLLIVWYSPVPGRDAYQIKQQLRIQAGNLIQVIALQFH